MDNQKSILDRIIQSKNVHETAQFRPADLMSELLKDLTPKEREVISRRFGLESAGIQTLEEIGKTFQITRERVRQIQAASVRKIKELAISRQRLDTLRHIVTRLIHEHGGIIEASALFEQLLQHGDQLPQHRQAAHFIVSQLLADEVDRVRQSEHFLPGWKLKLLDEAFVQQALEVLRRIIEAEQRLLKVEDLLERFKQHEFFLEHRQRFIPLGLEIIVDEEEALNRVLHSYLTISRQIDCNLLGEWGLMEWATVRPRRMGDKIYLILRQVGSPLHFTDITQKINEAKFDHKVAYPATIHNELILDERYVLVGRGIYALHEWGYEPGTVGDVVVKILSEAKQPLSRDEIVAEVAKRRLVRKSTVYLALTNRERFTKSGDRYLLNRPAA